MPRPSFYLSKGERNRHRFDFDPLSRYRYLAKGIYEWSGLPDDVPDGFIEGMLFDFGGVSAKDDPSLGIVIVPCSPVLLSIYGTPLTWIPVGLANLPPTAQTIMAESDNPVLWIGEPPARRAEIFAEILKQSLISLRQNIIALRQPIAVDGEPGNTTDGLMLMADLEGGEQYIPVIDAQRLGVQVLDLKAKDYTASLVGTYNAMDNEILTIIGLNNTGTEKASGVNIEEATSLHQELRITSDAGLKLRRQWCDRINARLGTSFSVRLASSYERTLPEERPEERPEGPEGDDIVE